MPTVTFPAADSGLPVEVPQEADWYQLHADGSFRQCTHKSHGMYPCTDPKICAAGHVFETYRYIMGVY